jgi:hypothetical protein
VAVRDLNWGTNRNVNRETMARRPHRESRRSVKSEAWGLTSGCQ